MQLIKNSIAVVLINYFNEKEIIQYIDSEIKKQTLQSEIFIVNNGTRTNLLKDYCLKNGIIFLDPERNTGYLGGLLYVLEYYLKNKLVFPKWFLLSNSDIEIEEQKMFSSIDNKSYPDDTAVLGVSIISCRNKSNQNPFSVERIKKNKLKRLSFIFSNRILYNLYQLGAIVKRMLHQENTIDKIQRVYAVHGSFIFIEGNFLKTHIAEFKNAPLLFGEELVIAEVALKSNQAVIYDPSYKVLHREHQTTGMFKSKKHLKLLKQSVDYIINQLKINKF
jgi:hypothetical protein